MSDDYSKDEGFFNRRKFLRGMGGAVGASALGVMGTQSVAADSHAEVEELSDSKASQQLQDALSGHEAKNLKQQAVEQGFSPLPDHVVAVSIESDDEELNEADPVSVFLPFNKQDGDGMALLVTLVVDTESGDRTPAAGWITAAEPDGGENEVSTATDTSLSKNEQKYRVENYEWDDQTDNVKIADQRMVDGPSQQAVSADGAASTQDLPDIPNIIPAGLCFVVINEACRRYGSGVAISRCVPICFKSANPAVTVGCSGLCAGIVAVLNRYGCKSSGSFLCGALGLSA